MKVGPVHTKKTPTMASVLRAGRSVTDITLLFLRVARRLELCLRHILLMLDIRHSLDFLVDYTQPVFSNYTQTVT